MWGDGDKMTMIGHMVTLLVVVVLLVGLAVSFIRKYRAKMDTPWRDDGPAKGASSSVEATELESMRQTLGLRPKADEEKDREHARRVLAKGRVRRFFGK